MAEEEQEENRLLAASERLFVEMHYDRKFERFIDTYVRRLWEQYGLGDHEARDRLMFIRNYCVTDMYGSDDLTPVFVDAFNDEREREVDRELRKRAKRDVRGTLFGMVSAATASLFEPNALYVVIPIGIAGLLYTFADGAAAMERLQERQESQAGRLMDTYGSLEEAMSYNLFTQRASMKGFLEDKGFL